MRTVAIAALTACAPHAWALQADLGFGLGAEFSDNINLAPAGQEEEASVGIATARLNMAERNGETDAALTALLQYRDYQTSSFDDELVLTLDARAVWPLEPGRYNWHLEDHFEQATVNVFAAPTPANRQNTNVLSTGPEGRWRLGDGQTVIGGLRYGNFYFEESDADSNRFSGYGRWLYAMNARTDLSANLEGSLANYTDSRYEDYRRVDGFVRVTTRMSRSTLEGDVGATAIRRDESDAIDGFLGRLALHTTFNSYSAFDASLEHQYTDVGHDILDMATRDDGIGVLDENITGDIFYNRQLEAGYHWDGVRTHWRITGAVRDEDYDVSPNDRRYEEGQVGLGYDMTPALRVAVMALYRRADYHEVDQVNTDHVSGFRIDYQLNSRLSSSLDLVHTERESTLASAAFEENRIVLNFTYSRAPGFVPAAVEE